MSLYSLVIFLLIFTASSYAKQPIPANLTHYSNRTAKRQIARLYQKLQAGDDFGHLAQIYSQDYGSCTVGGDLGWQKPAIFVPPFVKAVGRLSEGQLTKPFKSAFGYHIVQLLGRRPDTILTRHILLRVDS